MAAIRCVNLDWLEVYVIEPTESRDESYFSSLGYHVKAREYGTPMYKEMFTIMTDDNRAMYEIRRAPYSVKSNGGIFPDGASHIRLTNRECYRPNAVVLLREFLARHGYDFVSISRFDLCADFNNFDNGHDPADFLRRYLAGYYHKIGLSRVRLYGHDFDGGAHVVKVGRKVLKSAVVEHVGHQVCVHGRDKMRQLVFNSARWGSPTSQVSVKLYDKTLELHEQKEKFHIRDAWKHAGIDQNKAVWRLEFQVNSSAKDWIWDEEGRVYNLTLRTLESPETLNFLWSCLAAKYFVFTRREETRNGTEQRKDRAARYMPFKLDDAMPFYPTRLTTDREPKRGMEKFAQELYRFSQDGVHPASERIKADDILKYLARFRISVPRQ